MTTPVLGYAEVVKAMRDVEHLPHHHCYAMYSSVLGGIVTDPAFMQVPLDDHAVTRGHAVFDTCCVVNGSAYLLDMHIDRLVRSAIQARIDVDRIGKAELRRIVLATIAAAGQRDSVFVRMWLSAGRGDFNITPSKCFPGPTFYVVVHRDLSERRKGVSLAGCKETMSVVPMKNTYLATMKSNNYLVNAVCAMDADERGGHYGLQVDENGNLAELAIGSIALVTKDGWLCTPKLGRILRSTTVLRAFELLPQLVEKGVIKGFEYRDLKPKDAVEAVELFGLGGHCATNITHLDGKEVGNGKPGLVFREVAELLFADSKDGGKHAAVPWDEYVGSGTTTLSGASVTKWPQIFGVVALLGVSSLLSFWLGKRA